jgi:hypothetical protein
MIRNGQVRVVHASYTPPQEVVDEPLDTSLVIAYSARRGYVETPDCLDRARWFLLDKSAQTQEEYRPVCHFDGEDLRRDPWHHPNLWI